MPVATNQQVQAYSDEVLRPLCERTLFLIQDMQAAIAGIAEVYANLTASNPSSTWTDGNTGNPPNLLTVANLLAINAFLNNTVNALTADSGWPIVEQACVNLRRG